MNTVFDNLCAELVSTVTIFYTNFEPNLRSENMTNLRKISKEIRDCMYKPGFTHIASNLVKDITSKIDSLYISWSPNQNSDGMLSLLRVNDKLSLYIKNDFENLWIMETEDNVNLKKKYPGLHL